MNDPGPYVRYTSERWAEWQLQPSALRSYVRMDNRSKSILPTLLSYPRRRASGVFHAAVSSQGVNVCLSKLKQPADGL